MIFLVGQAYVSRIFRLSRAEASQLWGHSWTWIAELPCAVELRRLEAFKCFSDRGRFFLPLLACFFAMHFKSAFSLLSFYFPSFPLRTFNTFLRLKKVEEERAGVHDFQLLCGTFECRAGSTICATGWLWHLQKPQIYSLTMPNGGGDTGLPWPQLEIVFHQNDRLIARWWIEYVWMHWRGVCEYCLVFLPFGPYKWPFGPYKCPTGYSYTSPQFQSMSFLFGIKSSNVWAWSQKSNPLNTDRPTWALSSHECRSMARRRKCGAWEQHSTKCLLAVCEGEECQQGVSQPIWKIMTQNQGCSYHMSFPFANCLCVQKPFLLKLFFWCPLVPRRFPTSQRSTPPFNVWGVLKRSCMSLLISWN